jgi:hypothetical protein
MTNDELLTVMRNRRVEVDCEAELIRVLEENADLRVEVSALSEPMTVIALAVKRRFGMETTYEIKAPDTWESRKRYKLLIWGGQVNYAWGCGDTLGECLDAAEKCCEERQRRDADRVTTEGSTPATAVA